MGTSKGHVQQQSNSQVQEPDPANKTNGRLKLTKAQYFEWSLDIANIELAKKDLLILNLRQDIHDKELQIAALNKELIRNGQRLAETKLEKVKKEYEIGKKKMEEEVGITVKEYTISESLEVIPIEKG